MTRFWNAMRKRLEEFSLSLHPDKTRLIEFGRHAADRRATRSAKCQRVGPPYPALTCTSLHTLKCSMEYNSFLICGRKFTRLDSIFRAGDGVHPAIAGVAK